MAGIFGYAVIIASRKRSMTTMMTLQKMAMIEVIMLTMTLLAH